MPDYESILTEIATLAAAEEPLELRDVPAFVIEPGQLLHRATLLQNAAQAVVLLKALETATYAALAEDHDSLVSVAEQS